jgi:hypothetical protein
MTLNMMKRRHLINGGMGELGDPERVQHHDESVAWPCVGLMKPPSMLRKATLGFSRDDAVLDWECSDAG